MAYSNKGGIRIIGAVVAFVSAVLLFFNFMGLSFFSIAFPNGFSPFKMFTLTFSMGELSALLAQGGMSIPGLVTAGVILSDVLFVACIALAILTGVMALVNRKYFSGLWMAIAFAVLCILWLVASFATNSAIKNLLWEYAGREMGVDLAQLKSMDLNSLLADMGGMGDLGDLSAMLGSTDINAMLAQQGITPDMLKQQLAASMGEAGSLPGIQGQIAALLAAYAGKGIDNALASLNNLASLRTGADVVNLVNRILPKFLPTLWLILAFLCGVAPAFLLRKAELVSEPPIDYTPEVTVPVTQYVDPGEVTMASNRSNLQGVQVRVQYTDNSGSHIVKRQILTDSPLTIGRSDQCKLVLDDSRASGVHARLTYDDLNGLVIEDNGSTNGVQVNGETIMKHRRISKDDTVRLGDSKLNFTVTGSLDEFDGERTIAAGERYHEPVRVKLTFVDDSGNRVETVILKEVAMIGRLRECEVPVDSTTVSQKHARLLNRGNGRVAIEDNASSNGVKVNGEKITAATPIGTGDVITLGDVNLRVTVGR